MTDQSAVITAFLNFKELYPIVVNACLVLVVSTPLFYIVLNFMHKKRKLALEEYKIRLDHKREMLRLKGADNG